MICNQCGKEAEYYVSGGSCGWRCKKCGWSILTTHTEAIDLDNNEYTIEIKRMDKPEIKAIKCISELLSCNFLQAKQNIQTRNVHQKGHAREILLIAKKFVECGIDFKITPNFPYDID